MHLRVCVNQEIVIEFDYSRMVKFFVDPVLSTGVSEKMIEWIIQGLVIPKTFKQF